MSGLSDSGVVLLELAEFFLLAGLGLLFMQLLTWHAILEDNRAEWLRNCQTGARKMRLLRRQLERVDGDWMTLPLSPRWRRKWNMLRWVGQALKMARFRRP